MVEVIREIYFRLDNMVEWIGISFGFYAGFLLIKHVIGTTGDAFY